MPKHDHCCVPQCTSRREKEQSLSFHTFPVDPELRKKWVHAIRRDEKEGIFTITGNTVVCSKHFSEMDYFSSAPLEPQAKRVCRRLRKNSVPSRFSFGPAPAPERPSREERLESGRKRAEALVAKPPKRKRGETEREGILSAEVAQWKDRAEALQAQIDSLMAEVLLLKSQLFRYDNIKHDGKQLAYLTGLSPGNWDLLWNFLKVSDENILSQSASRTSLKGRRIAKGSGRKSTLSLEDQLLITLMRLRLGRLENELAYLFGCDEATISRIFIKWLNFLYLRLGQIPLWPTWDDVEKSMPDCFRCTYPSTFVVLDATELRCEVPSALDLQSSNYSTYKSHTTVKGLVGIAPNGTFIFISQLFTGSISDRQIVLKSGILEYLDSVPPRKNVMADRGFNIQDLLVKKDLLLNIPPFKGSRASLTKEEVIRTQKIATVRIHIERCIGRVKRLFRLLDRVIPLTLYGAINQIWSVCCLLTNFLDQIVPQTKPSQ